ncbi:MAG: hypothetical protein S4CHLAM45_06350 [Chlamydiales bacterium]|nr:hypothetical protein [Chlamydiales bacterium]MCH9619825.1 hypothetical protein [Chlamydiales bacterium]MCH9622748.1 hypothetical protein [Chlamydiales bacterium]
MDNELDLLRKIDKIDLKLLFKYQEHFIPHIEEVVDEFLEWFSKNTTWLAYFRDKDLFSFRTRILEYWKAFFTLLNTPDFISSRHRVGDLHATNQVPADDYICAYNHILNRFLEIAQKNKAIAKEDKDLLFLSIHNRGIADICIILKKFAQSDRRMHSQIRDQHRETLMGIFTLTISDEFLNPMTALLNNIQLTKELVMENERAVSRLENSEKIVMDCVHVITTLRLFAKQDVSVEKSIASTNCIDVLDQVLFFLETTSKAEDITIIRDFDPSSPAVEMKVADIRYTFLTLFVFVISLVVHCPVREIIVSVKPADGDLEIVIKDSGQGLSKEDKDLVFTPYFSKVKSKIKGADLLFCREVIEENGGKISLESVEGNGTTFTIRFPGQKK